MKNDKAVKSREQTTKSLSSGEASEKEEEKSCQKDFNAGKDCLVLKERVLKSHIFSQIQEKEYCIWILQFIKFLPTFTDSL